MYLKGGFQLATLSPAMPRKPKRNDVPVKIDADVLKLARIVAAYEDVPIAELLSETMRPILEERLKQHQLKPKKRHD